MTKQTKGKYGEDLAVAFLLNNGFAVAETNFRCRLGEIDIISRKNGYLIFTEVKYRQNLNFGLPREAVTKNKQRHIRRVALYYLQIKNLGETDMRFDVIEIIDSGEPAIELIENAF